MKAPKLNKELIVFRGVHSFQAAEFAKLKKGETYTQNSFISTSLDINLATTFSLMDATEFGGLLKIILPKFTPFVLLPGSGQTQYGDKTSLKEVLETQQYKFEEHEVLLNKNSTFKLEKKQKIMLGPKITQMKTKSYNEENFINVYTLRLIGSREETFNLEMKELIDYVKQVEIKLS